MKLSRTFVATVVGYLAMAGCNSSPDIVDTTLNSEPAGEIAQSEPAPEASIAYQDEAVNAVTPSSVSFSPSQQALVDKYMVINDNCRGGSGDAGKTWHQCAKRDLLEPQMRRAELCYGRQSDQSEADMSWHVCQPDSLSYNDHPGSVPTGRCRITIGGETIYEGRCLVDLQKGGSFWVMSVDQRVFASVDRTTDQPTALIDADGRTFANGGDLGAVERTNACWGNAEAEICAWG